MEQVFQFLQIWGHQQAVIGVREGDLRADFFFDCHFRRSASLRSLCCQMLGGFFVDNQQTRQIFVPRYCTNRGRRERSFRSTILDVFYKAP